MIANIIDKARTKQRSLVLTLLDLKNAFGEVHHNLIQEVLLYHHITAKTKELISSLYTDLHTSVITDNYLTPAVPVRKGVLQGDYLSPLLFNMYFNTFILYIRQEKYMQLGFSSHDKLIVFSNQFIGSSLQMMQLLSQPTNEKIKFF